MGAPTGETKVKSWQDGPPHVDKKGKKVGPFIRDTVISTTSTSNLLLC